MLENPKTQSISVLGIDLLAPSPLQGLSHSSVPVLLIHGEDDDLIPAQELFQAAQGLARRCHCTPIL